MQKKSNTRRNHTPNSEKADKFIIGIGASAGGMGAIHELFDYTQTDAVSYVIIQHLSPDHKSFMKELLVKHSKLKIFVAENQMDVNPNCVYVLPEGKNMTIHLGVSLCSKTDKVPLQIQL
jgi:two-component system, chemotaxis family, CheB/CheR fusion protein